MAVQQPSADPAAAADEHAIIDEVAEGVGKLPEIGEVQSPVTPTGLPVEEQVRKEWTPDQGGLPTFFQN